MTKTIWKYPIRIEDDFEIEMPLASAILDAQVQYQNSTPYLWVLVNPDNPLVTRQFRIFGTGHNVNESNLNYIGTFQINQYVWHLFEAITNI